MCACAYVRVDIRECMCVTARVCCAGICVCMCGIPQYPRSQVHPSHTGGSTAYVSRTPETTQLEEHIIYFG